MTDPERIEKLRQAIMRYRELLDLAHKHIANGERNYEVLFREVTEEQRQTLPQKALQREAALLLLEDIEPLRRAVSQLRFAMRDLENGFDDVFGNLVEGTD